MAMNLNLDMGHRFAQPSGGDLGPETHEDAGEGMAGDAFSQGASAFSGSGGFDSLSPAGRSLAGPGSSSAGPEQAEPGEREAPSSTLREMGLQVVNWSAAEPVANTAAIRGEMRSDVSSRQGLRAERGLGNAIGESLASESQPRLKALEDTSMPVQRIQAENIEKLGPVDLQGIDKLQLPSLDDIQRSRTAVGGDSWAKIARQEYGDERYALALARANGSDGKILAEGATVRLADLSGANLRAGGAFITADAAARQPAMGTVYDGGAVGNGASFESVIGMSIEEAGARAQAQRDWVAQQPIVPPYNPRALAAMAAAQQPAWSDSAGRTWLDDTSGWGKSIVNLPANVGEGFLRALEPRTDWGAIKMNVSADEQRGYVLGNYGIAAASFGVPLLRNGYTAAMGAVDDALTFRFTTVPEGIRPGAFDLGSSTMFYHGTLSDYAYAIRTNGIDLSKSSAISDFGRGFYMTNSRSEAISSASRLYGADDLSVVEFDVPNFEISKLSSLRFSAADASWSDFVTVNRKFGEGLPLHGGAPYDLVFGPLFSRYSKGTPISWADRTPQTSLHTPSAVEVFNDYVRKSR